MNFQKNFKIKVYYTEESIVPGSKPPIVEGRVKVYIHSEKSQGLWCSARDLSLSETLAAEQVEIKIALRFTVNWSEKIIDKWNDLFIEFKNETFKIQSKPDQLDYMKGDMIIDAIQIIDPEEITVVRYE